MVVTSPPGVSQGIRAARSGFAIGGTQIVTHSGDLNLAPVPNRIGDILIAYTQGKMYIAGGVSASSDWKLVTSA